MKIHAKLLLAIVAVAATSIAAAVQETAVSDCKGSPDQFGQYAYPRVIHALVADCPVNFSPAEKQYAAHAAGEITQWCNYHHPGSIPPVAIRDKRKLVLWIAGNLTAEAISRDALRDELEPSLGAWYRQGTDETYESSTAQDIVDASKAARHDFWANDPAANCDDIKPAIVRGIQRRVLRWFEAQSEPGPGFGDHELPGNPCGPVPDSYFRRYWHPEVVHSFVEDCRLELLPHEHAYMRGALNYVKSRCKIGTEAYDSMSVAERQLWTNSHVASETARKNRLGMGGTGRLNIADSNGWRTDYVTRHPAHWLLAETARIYFDPQVQPELHDFSLREVDCATVAPAIVAADNRRVRTWYKSLDPQVLAAARPMTVTDVCGEPPDAYRQRYTYPDVMHAITTNCSWNFGLAEWTYAAMWLGPLQENCAFAELPAEQSHKVNVYFRDTYSKKVAAAVFVPAGSEDTATILAAAALPATLVADAREFSCDTHARELFDAWVDRAITYYDRRYEYSGE